MRPVAMFDLRLGNAAAVPPRSGRDAGRPRFSADRTAYWFISWLKRCSSFACSAWRDTWRRRHSEQRHGIQAVIGINADADAGADAQFVAVDEERGFQRRQQLLRDIAGMLAARDVEQPDDDSSPPTRATTSASRRAARKRWPICSSRRSPTSWPRLSLIGLKRFSRMNSKAPCIWLRWASDQRLFRRSFWNSVRFGEGRSVHRNRPDS